VAVSGGRARRADERAFRAANRLADERVDAAASAITELGSIWASAGALPCWRPGDIAARRCAARAAAGVTWPAGQGLKRLFERPRPYQADADGTRLLIGPPSAASWPSSHPAVLLSFVEVVGRELGWRARHAPRSSGSPAPSGPRASSSASTTRVTSPAACPRAGGRRGRGSERPVDSARAARDDRLAGPGPIHLFGDFAISPHGIDRDRRSVRA
jgi:hypothetical protein